MYIVQGATADPIENTISSLGHWQGESQSSSQVIGDDICVGQAYYGKYKDQSIGIEI